MYHKRSSDAYRYTSDGFADNMVEQTLIVRQLNRMILINTTLLDMDSIAIIIPGRDDVSVTDLERRSTY